MSTQTIYTQILKFQENFPTIKKDSKNPHLKNEYASLPTILSTVLPLLNNLGIVLSSQVHSEHSDIYVIQLVHAESGSSVSSHVKLLNMSDMQKWGSCVTYATRYGLLSLLGIAADMDDDGNHTKDDGNTTKHETKEAHKSEELTLSRSYMIGRIRERWPAIKENAVAANAKNAENLQKLIDENFVSITDGAKIKNWYDWVEKI